MMHDLFTLLLSAVFFVAPAIVPHTFVVPSTEVFAAAKNPFAGRILTIAETKK